MKKLIATVAAITAVSATAALADGFYVDGSMEYAVEAEMYDLNAGVNYDFMGLTTYADANFGAAALKDMTFTGTELGASLEVTEFASVYGAVELDDGFEYTE